MEKETVLIVPKFSKEEATQIIKSKFGFEVAECSPLPSYDDQNWKIETNGLQKWDLKETAVKKEKFFNISFIHCTTT